MLNAIDILMSALDTANCEADGDSLITTLPGVLPCGIRRNPSRDVTRADWTTHKLQRELTGATVDQVTENCISLGGRVQGVFVPAVCGDPGKYF